MSRWPGTWRVICDVCGFEFASDKVRKRWDNLYVCEQDYETRHPQDFIKIRSEQSVPSFTRPEQPDEFVAVCYLPGLSAYPGLAVPGCSIPGNTQFTEDFLAGLTTNGHE